MIIRPDKWKSELEKEQDSFLRFLNEKGVNNDDFDYYLERYFFISAFIIRKLLESAKLSKDITITKEKVPFFKKKENAIINHYNYLYVESIYEMGVIFPFHILEDNFKDVNFEELTIKDILNIIIHSTVLNVVSAPNAIYGILVTTDSRKNKLYYLKFDQMKSIVQNCIIDQVIL